MLCIFSAEAYIKHTTERVMQSFLKACNYFLVQIIVKLNFEKYKNNREKLLFLMSSKFKVQSLKFKLKKAP